MRAADSVPLGTERYDNEGPGVDRYVRVRRALRNACQCSLGSHRRSSIAGAAAMAAAALRQVLHVFPGWMDGI